jgi:transmembrane sensor
MMDVDRSPTRLHERVRHEQDAALDAVDRAPGRERFVRRATALRRPIRARSHAWMALVAAALVAVCALVLLPTGSLQFEVDGTRGRASEWMAAPAKGASELRFSDGTELELRDEGRARVEDLDARGARVVVERGTIEARVVHRPDTRWLVQAGPFDVRVTGTRFVTSWDPAAGRFLLVLEEGSVMVTGPSWRGERSLRAGESIDLHVPSATVASVPSADVVAVPDAVAPRASSEPRASARSSAPTDALRAPHAQPGASVEVAADVSVLDRVRSLASQNAYREAYDLAAGAGLLAADADAATTALLADVSRLSGHAASARELLGRLRSRFPASRHASEAAFLLGRMDFDAGQTGSAQRWFTAYLSERPDGPLAMDVRGRMLECVMRSGDEDAVRAEALRYLARHPSGPHAELARRASAPSPSPSPSPER